jgi:nucleoside-triphosphatase
LNRILLMTGAPGVGKTTLVRQVATRLEGLRVAGFTTEEIRKDGRRLGFRVVPCGGPEAIMAHVDFRGAERVGRYGVDVAAIDAVAVATLGRDPDVDLYVVDEIGKMECLSERFVVSMRTLLDSDRRVLATIAQKGGGFIAEAKRHGDLELWEVTVRNRNLLAERILTWLGLT